MLEMAGKVPSDQKVAAPHQVTLHLRSPGTAFRHFIYLFYKNFLHSYYVLGSELCTGEFIYLSNYLCF